MRAWEGTLQGLLPPGSTFTTALSSLLLGPCQGILPILFAPLLFLFTSHTFANWPINSTSKSIENSWQSSAAWV